jgi:hypothetical protein
MPLKKQVNKYPYHHSCFDFFGKKRRKVCVMAALGPKVPLIPILERGSVFQVVRAARLLFW